jgi:isochorismate pyruvate lyase
MKTPDECTNKADIREAIDQIDHEIVALLGKRAAYVQAIVKFKNSPDEVRADERFRTVLQQRRQWAQEMGINPDMIEQMYRILVEHFIADEMETWRNEQG